MTYEGNKIAPAIKGKYSNAVECMQACQFHTRLAKQRVINQIDFHEIILRRCHFWQFMPTSKLCTLRGKYGNSKRYVAHLAKLFFPYQGPVV